MTDSLRVRLLRDIAELQTKPYPNITLHVHDEDIEEACLILTSEGYGPMHLTIEFPPDYPIAPPEIKMDSDVFHPNVEKSYICASILMTEEGYTPAYTLKGIAIQLLSFFSSDRIEQVGGQFSIDLAAFKETHSNQVFGPTHCCTSCGFGMGSIGATRVRKASVVLSGTISEAPSSPQLSKISVLDSTPATSVSGDEVSGTYRWEDMDRKIIPKLETAISLLDLDNDEPKPQEAFLEAMTSPASASIPVSSVPARRLKGLQRTDLPDEVILVICDMLETEDLLLLGEAWDRVQFIMTEYDLLRIRQLQCFCFRTDFEESKLGVGVNATFSESRQGFFESEFDLLSEEGYHVYGIRRSVQGVEFEHWLPLPISEDHWEWVKYDVEETLWDMSINAKLGAVPAIQVIIHFMSVLLFRYLAIRRLT
jgi:ubiquitin-protein ligase